MMRTMTALKAHSVCVCHACDVMTCLHGMRLKSKGPAWRGGVPRAARRTAMAMRSHLARLRTFAENRGPESLEELAAWDEFVVGRLTQFGLASHALESLQRGLLVTTDHSGMEFPQESMRIIVLALFDSFEKPPPTITHARCSDWGDIQSFTLNKQSRLHGGHTCVFSDMSDRAGKVAREWLDEVAPTKQSQSLQPAETAAVAAAAANKDIADFLGRNGEWVFPSDRRCPCVLHRQMCPAYPGRVMAMAQASESSRLETEPVVGGPAKRRRVGSSAPAPQPWWQQPPLPHEDGTRPLILNIAG